jgi:type I restriction enzyme S subunit
MDDLTPYAETKNAGAPWLNRVPEHWEVVRSRYLFREIDRRSATGAETHLSMSQKLGLVPNSEVDHRILVSESYIGAKLVEPNDLVLNRLKAHLGVFAIAHRAGLVSSDYSVFRPADGANVRFFEYALRSSACRAELRTRAKGIVEGFWRLYSPDFYQIRLPVPSAEEQRQKVRFLDAHGAVTARLIRAKRRLIQLLEEQKQAIICRAITRGLHPHVPMRRTGIEWMAEIPAHWKLRRLKTLVLNIAEHANALRDSDTYVALEHVKSWTGEVLAPSGKIVFDSQVKSFQAGDILFGKLRPYLAKVARIPRQGVCVGEFLVLRVNTDEIIGSYLEADRK